MRDITLIGFGVALGLIISSIYLLFINRCKHDWEHKGILSMYWDDTCKYPMYRDDSYTCKKCKKNKKEIK